MHEATLVSALLARVEAEVARHPGARVRRVEVALGELAGVEGEQLASAWELFRAGTCCAGAELALSATPARWQCPRCGGILPAAILRCPACAVPARLASGGDVVLTRLEMEVDDV